MRVVATIVLTALAGIAVAFAQTDFNVQLRLNFDSANEIISLYKGVSGNPEYIAHLRGSQIALATTGLLAQRRLTTADLVESLEAAKYGQSANDNVFRMEEARSNVEAIDELLTAVKRRNFGQRVVATVAQLFPASTRLATSIPVFFVAFGHQNIDAYVRKVVWHGDVPSFAGDNEPGGELTIVVNLAKGVYYGRDVEERFIGLLSIVAHEVFHAAFGVFKENSPAWREYYATHNSWLDGLLDLTQNEGIAHYLTFEQRTNDQLPSDWDQRVHTSFDEFNKKSSELLLPGISPGRASRLIQSSNTSGYWESYGAITGLFIARQIDRTLGREALAESIANGPEDFFSKYVAMANHDHAFPALSQQIVRHITGRN
jgi:Putative zinc dependent peptidase (DUF5700)